MTLLDRCPKHRDSTPLKSTLDQISCARLPATALLSLARLRAVEGIFVLEDGDHPWVFWEPGNDQVARALLPVPGVELYERRGEHWHRAGRRLPSFAVPPAGHLIPLSQAVTPEPFSADRADTNSFLPTTLRLIRNAHPRSTSASLCPMSELCRWANQAPSFEIEAIRGAFQDGWALLLGPNLPPWRGATRYWGRRVLVPIGFEARPSLPEEAMLEAFHASKEAILRVVADGDRLTVEVIPLEVFRPLTRAGVRLASASLTAGEGGHR